MAKKTTRKDEYMEYIGEYVTLNLKDCMTIVNDGEGNTVKMGFVEGFVVDVSDTHLRMGETPEKEGYTTSIDFDVIGVIQLNDENIMGNLMANVPSEDEDVH